jgi:DNA-binding YbaB/EbfC family protein
MMKANISSIMKQAKKIQEDIQKVQDNLENIMVEGTSGGGMVNVKVNCKLKILSITIEPEVLKEDDKEMIEDLLVAAVNQALQNAQEKANEELAKVSGGIMDGLNLPGGMKFPGF